MESTKITVLPAQCCSVLCTAALSGDLLDPDKEYQLGSTLRASQVTNLLVEFHSVNPVGSHTLSQVVSESIRRKKGCAEKFVF